MAKHETSATRTRAETTAHPGAPEASPGARSPGSRGSSTGCPARSPGGRDALTRAQARAEAVERRLRTLPRSRGRPSTTPTACVTGGSSRSSSREAAERSATAVPRSVGDATACGSRVVTMVPRTAAS